MCFTQLPTLDPVDRVLDHVAGRFEHSDQRRGRFPIVLDQHNCSGSLHHIPHCGGTIDLSQRLTFPDQPSRKPVRFQS